MPLTVAAARRAVQAVMRERQARKLSLPDAWLAAAERIEDGKEHFCCVAVDSLYWEEAISRTTRDEMHARVGLDLDGRYTAYDGHEFDDNNALGPEAHAARVLACLMFAEEAADETANDLTIQ